MKITSESDRASSVRQVVNVPGLVNIQIVHSVKETDMEYSWLGPRISREKWLEAVAFLRHINQTSHSEAQLRMFIDLVEKRWVFWAFPQKAKTGMHANELDTPEAKAQWALFPGERYLPYGTLHSHCDASAFQSGTDEKDERVQDGLHITLGHLSSNKLDFHARLYQSQNKITPDMTWFWDVGPEIGVVLASMQAVGLTAPAGWLHGIAISQMCEIPHKGVIIPQQWLDNVVEVPEPPAQKSGFFGWDDQVAGRSQFNSSPYAYGSCFNRETNHPYDITKALEGIEGYSRIHGWSEDEVLECLAELQDETLVILSYLLYHHDLTAGALHDAYMSKCINGECVNDVDTKSEDVDTEKEILLP